MDLNAKRANTTSSNNELRKHQVVTPANTHSSSGVAEEATKLTTTVTTTSSEDHNSRLSCVVCRLVDMCSCDTHRNMTSSASSSGKRKRRSSTKDPEIGFEPPSAKRQQCVAVAYSCEVESNQSSRDCPTENALNVHEAISLRNSPPAEISETSHSPLPDSPDSPPSPDRGAKQLAKVVRYSTGGTEVSKEDDGNGEEYTFDEEEITSSIPSPASSTATGCSQNGERTPATQQMHQSRNGQRSVNKLNSLEVVTAHNNYKCLSPALEKTLRQCPLPALSWANAADVWEKMCTRDEEDSHLRSSTMLEEHPGLQPRMRAILLDWLNEVCEVYKLHRESYYLAVDYLDRYLTRARQVQKTHLQLIGITCLFVAAKVEEIYPPKICEFAYVTDGACTEHDILQQEKLLLQALRWHICPVTPTAWLGIYMQLNVNNLTPASFSRIGKQVVGATGEAADDAFIYPQFSTYEFVQTSQLLDLCSLDVGMANYSYSVLAAAAISHAFNRETALRCSGLDWQAIETCVRWMKPFFNVISNKAPYLQLNEQNEQVTNKFGLSHICPNIVTDDSHIIQTHTTTMDMYDELLMTQNALHLMRARTQASPATALRAPESVLTPPASSQKPDDEYLGDEEEVTATTMAAAGDKSKNQLQSDQLEMESPIKPSRHT